MIAKPLTYMNLSGGPVASLAQFYKIAPEQIIAVHDELDLPFGQLRAKIGGGEGGHNGLRSMSKSLGTKDYVRVRFGIGRPPGRQDPADYVLSDFSAERAQGTGFPGRPRRRHRRIGRHAGPGVDPERLPRRLNLTPPGDARHRERCLRMRECGARAIGSDCGPQAVRLTP